MLARRSLLVMSIGSMVLLPETIRAQAAEPFERWLDAFRARARDAGIQDGVLDTALAGAAPIERIIELDRRQPEGRLSFAQYRERVITNQRVSDGARRLRRHAAILDNVEDRYGVPPSVIVALWGIESSFGDYKGKFPVIDALATLAYEGRRAEFFEGELIAALRILQNGDIDGEHMTGSWAGALGQCQFMPSSYLRYAVDFDGDGRRDIWENLPDVFASTANYLSEAGYRPGYIWGRSVGAPAGLLATRGGLDTALPLATWAELGVRRAGGQALPKADIEASLIQVDDRSDLTFLVYSNFKSFMAWNRSTYFALSVGMLADRIATTDA